MMLRLLVDPAAVSDAVRGVWAPARAVVVLAVGSSPKDIDPSTGKGPEWGKAAPIGLLVIVLLGVACYFLARSMSKNLRRVPDAFEGTESSNGAVSAVPGGVPKVGPPQARVDEPTALPTGGGRPTGGPAAPGQDADG